MSEFRAALVRHIAWMRLATACGTLIVGAPLRHYIESMEARKFSCDDLCPWII